MIYLKQDWSTNPESTNLKYQEWKGDIPVGPEDVKSIIRRHYQWLYPSKNLNFNDKDIFLEEHNLAKQILEEIEPWKTLLKNLKAEKMKKIRRQI